MIESFAAKPSTTQAGGHPDLTIAFSLDASPSAEIVKNIAYSAPAGFGLLPPAVPRCTAEGLELSECPIASQVGLITVRSRYEGQAEFLLGTAPVFALEPPSGQFGALGFTIPALDTDSVAGLSLRGASDYGQRLKFANLPEEAPITWIDLTLWGVPSEASHDAERFPKGSPGEPPGCVGLENTSCLTRPTASNSPLSPFTLNPTNCGSPLSSTLEVQTYESPEASESEASYPETTGCDQLTFNPSLYAVPTTTVAYSRSGLRLDLAVPQPMSPSVPTSSGLRKVAVTLPEGMDFNPELPEELVACTDAEAALGSEEPAACPEEALLGTAKLDLVGEAEPLEGEIYLGISGSEEEVRLLLIAEGGGVNLKLPLGLSEEAESGQLKLALEQPQIPISEDNFKFFGGPFSLLRTPLYCGMYPISATFTPWDESLGTQTSTQFFKIESGPRGGPCLGEAKTLSIDLSPETLLPDGKSQTKVTVRITDAEGAGIPEQEVKITSSDPGQRVSEVTDYEDGFYTATITASTTPEIATITATDLSVNPKLSDSASLTQQGSASLTQQEVTTDTKAPQPIPPSVSFTTKPLRADRNRRPRFEFAADAPGSNFTCKLDHGPYHPCSSPLKLPKLSLGVHVFSVRATSVAGTGSPAVWHFRVLRGDRQGRRDQRR